MKAIASAALIVCAFACSALGLIFLGFGSVAAFIGVVHEVLPRLSQSAGRHAVGGEVTGLGIGVLFLGLVHLGLVVPQVFAALLVFL